MELARFDSGDRLKDAAHGSFGDQPTIKAAFRRRIGSQDKLVRGPKFAQRRTRPRPARSSHPMSSHGWRWPSRARRAPIAFNARVDNKADMTRPNFLRDRDFQHWGNNQIRHFVRHRSDHRLSRSSDADTDVVATPDQFDQEPLAKAIMGRRGQAHQRL